MSLPMHCHDAVKNYWSHAISVPSFASFHTLRDELRSHLKAIVLRTQIAVGSTPEGWTDVDVLLLFKGRVFLPDEPSLWPQVLEHVHTMGHDGSEKTLHHIRAAFYNPSAHRRVREFVHGCSVCQRNKMEHLHSTGLLQPLLVPDQVWSDISMDFVEGFPKIGGKSVILTVVDRFSKYAHFIPLSHLIQQVQLLRFSSIMWFVFMEFPVL
jgi:hypothetical protein